MGTIWFCLVAIMVAGYVILDGFDLGAGALHLFVAKTDSERRNVLRSIGPIWNGNEVWLLAGGGTLYFAFPELYSSAFSGFYLPLMMVLWLLILRGISIEFRSHLESPVWRPLWDFVFFAASALLIIFFGAALGNVVRGVPVSTGKTFFLPLWTTWSPYGEPGILDWFTVLTGVTALAALVHHGARWLVYKNTGVVHQRAESIARRSLWTLALLTVVLTAASFSVQPRLAQSFGERPWGVVFPALAVIPLVALLFVRMSELNAFLASSLFLTGMLTSCVFGVYPYVLPSNNLAENQGLTVANTAAADYGLTVGLYWFVPGMLLAIGYFSYVYRSFAGKVGEPETNSY